VGPGAKTSGSCLKSHVERGDNRFVYFAVDKHTDDVIELMGLRKAKGQAMPGSHATGASLTDPDGIAGD
jgi:hypothetical protein